MSLERTVVIDTHTHTHTDCFLFGDPQRAAFKFRNASTVTAHLHNQTTAKQAKQNQRETCISFRPYA